MFYRLVLRSLIGGTHIPKLTIILQNPQVQYSPGSTPKLEPLGLTHWHTLCTLQENMNTSTLVTMTSRTQSRRPSAPKIVNPIRGMFRKSRSELCHFVIIEMCSWGKRQVTPSCRLLLGGAGISCHQHNPSKSHHSSQPFIHRFPLVQNNIN